MENLLEILTYLLDILSLIGIFMFLIDFKEFKYRIFKYFLLFVIFISFADRVISNELRQNKAFKILEKQSSIMKEQWDLIEHLTNKKLKIL